MARSSSITNSSASLMNSLRFSRWRQVAEELPTDRLLDNPVPDPPIDLNILEQITLGILEFLWICFSSNIRDIIARHRSLLRVPDLVPSSLSK